MNKKILMLSVVLGILLVGLSQVSCNRYLSSAYGDSHEKRSLATGDAENYVLLQKILADLRDANLSTDLGELSNKRGRLPGVDLGFGRAFSGQKLASYGEALQDSQSPLGPGRKRRSPHNSL